MARAIKKKNRRLKRTVRKTLGALFLASALIVAAIPVENLQADEPGNAKPLKVTVDAKNCRIPIVDDRETIYTTGDGRFQFAYVSTNDAAASNKVAVILGYDGGRLEGGHLTIPNEVDAYLKYSENLGTTVGYCAVGKSGNFLFYEVVVEKTDGFGNVITENDTSKPILDEEGNPQKDPITGEFLYEQKPVYEKQYKPCYYTDYSKWSDLEVDEFYYQTGTTTVSGTEVPKYSLTENSTVQRIQAAEVKYIGNQTLRAGKGADAGTWTVIPESEGGLVDTPEEGIFRGEKAGNIETLSVGGSLSGIGNYAFNGCTNLNSITLQNGLDTIGNYAFANCVNLETVDIEVTAMLTTIGDHAFYNCRGLTYFRTPRQVAKIGDSAFEGCTRLAQVELCGEGKNVQLSTLGNDVFKNCSALTAVVLPDSYEESNLDISMWEGCTSLGHITAQSGKVNFVETQGGSFTFDEFKETVPASFYFEGIKTSPLHLTATGESIAFKYLNEDVYEITIESDGKNAVYQVNSSNELIYCDISSGLKEVEIPSTIGPYQITSIWSTSFQGSCSLEKITIPSSIVTIEKEAFRGCHNLETVIFSEPVNVKTIGENAFQTQDVVVHQSGCTEQTLDSQPTLQFVGPVSYDCVPFSYAMLPTSNINVGSQVRSYITYYSSWPQNLQVQYNPDTDKNELINYPTFKEITDFKTLSYEAALAKYPYMTTKNVKDYVDAAKQAVDKYSDPATAATMTDYEKEIINAAIDIVLPEGIEAIKQGLFTTKEIDPSESSVEKSITAYSLIEIAAESFKDCKNLTKIDLAGGTTHIRHHAFAAWAKPEEPSLPKSPQEFRLTPLADCGKLSTVYFSENPNFTCANSIIYELDADGNKYKIIEYLEGRDSGVATASEFTGVKEIAEEAFMGTEVSSVDLRESQVQVIPAKAFAETQKLFAVYLPTTWNTIADSSFADSSLQYLEIPGSLGYIGNDAFTNHDSALTFYCEDGSSAKIYADNQGIKTTSKPVELYYTVRFWDYDNNLLDTQTVAAGADAVPPEAPAREGYVFHGWNPDYHGIVRDMDITAQYEPEDPDAHKYTVTFLDYDDTVLKTMLVAPGADAEPPFDPSREGYTFTGWRPSIKEIQADTVIYAQYEKKDSSQSQLTVRFIDHDDKVLYIQKVNYGEDAFPPQSPTREGYTFTGWRPALTNITKDLDTYAQYEKNGASGDNPGDTDKPGTTDKPGNTDKPGATDNPGNNNNNNNNQTTTKLYTLTVRNGSGSGSYAAGSQPIIIANDPAAKQEFSHWTISPANTKIASTVLTATVITMPEGDVTVTANYKAKSSSSGSSTTVTGSSNSSNTGKRPNNSETVSKGGTTVVIDKNGLSNTGVVSATVNGSSDNFTIKISESTAASEEVLRALMAEYGDLTNIKYFPMDISLYDSTGKNKITDTTGLSISITLPLPDSLITYAGNNKVAGVVDSKLDKLKPKFTTISGVSCVTFTAEHFSPYVIYVDTNNLTAGVVNDNTPKTGDGIHPKWFLSMGLACVSFVLFMKKDRRKLQKAKA